MDSPTSPPSAAPSLQLPRLHNLRPHHHQSSPSLLGSDEPLLPNPLPISAPGSRPGTASFLGGKRPAPSSLLPAFEPLSSSPPGLPRPPKRQNTGSRALPTPVPTSSTGILLSSSPVQSAVQRRLLPAPLLPAALQARLPAAASSPDVSPHSVATVSERSPLSAVPAVELSDNGESMYLGRSSNSSHFQLSANRLVSRVHVIARYIPPLSPDGAKIEILCNGWNGLKLHCGTRTWELYKGDSFTSATEGIDVMVDVQDARVMVQWPRRVHLSAGADPHVVAAAAAAAAAPGTFSDASSWDDSPPSARSAAGNAFLLQSSSPLRHSTRIASPESPTPAAGRLTMSSSQRLQQSLLLPPPGPLDDDGIQIYEDESCDENDVDDDADAAEPPSPDSPSHAASARLRELGGKKQPQQQQQMDLGASIRTEATASFSSDDGEENDPDEENDPIVHSFGPFGADINGRMASIMSASPKAMAAAAAARRHARNASSGDSLATLSNTGSAQAPLPASDMAPPQAGRSSGASNGRSSHDTEPVKKAASEVAVNEVASPPSLSSSPLSPPPPCASPLAAAEDTATPSVLDPAIANHVVNQLAFSRLSSTPLSTIVQHLPAEAREGGLDYLALRAAIEATPCIGIIRREGKDAAGKPLESEYYYIPEHDVDEQRRAVVDGMRKPSLRACRKQHKQYYWKRPRTP